MPGRSTAGKPRAAGRSRSPVKARAKVVSDNGHSDAEQEPSPRKKNEKKPASPPSSASSSSHSGDYVYVPPQCSLAAKHVFFPFYDWIVTFCPRWWTPNGITLVGIACTLTASLLVLRQLPASASMPTPTFFDGASIMDAVFPTADKWEAAKANAAAASAGRFLPTAIEPWLLVLVGVLNLIYCTADNIDGRHARRTQQSSPVGEYLDHGLDCITSLLSTSVLVGVGGLSLTAAGIGTLVIGYVTMCSHTLNIRRNIFIFGNEIVSVDEAMVGFGVLPILVAAAPWLRDMALPFVPQYRCVDLLFFLFIGPSQLSMLRLLSLNLPALVLDWLCIAQAVALSTMAYLAHAHAGGTSAPIARQFSHEVDLFGYSFNSYPAVWLLTAAAVASTLVHLPIAAKCVAKASGTPADVTQTRVPAWPLLYVAATLWVFSKCPHGGLALAATGHVVQVIANIVLIFAGAAKKKKAEK